MSTKSMHIEKMDGGFQTSTHQEQSSRGEYKMPESKVHKSHGSVMHDVHEMVHGHGSAEPAEDEEPCPMCAAGAKAGPKKDEAAPKPGPGAKGKSGKSTKGESPSRSASTLSEKAAKVAKKG